MTKMHNHNPHQVKIALDGMKNVWTVKYVDNMYKVQSTNYKVQILIQDFNFSTQRPCYLGCILLFGSLDTYIHRFSSMYRWRSVRTVRTFWFHSVAPSIRETFHSYDTLRHGVCKLLQVQNLEVSLLRQRTSISSWYVHVLSTYWICTYQNESVAVHLFGISTFNHIR